MKETLNNLWNEYLFEKSSVIETDEERKLTEKAVKLHEDLNALLNNDQQDAVQRYVDVLSELEYIFARKAFFKGCEFTVSFIFDALWCTSDAFAINFRASFRASLLDTFCLSKIYALTTQKQIKNSKKCVFLKEATIFSQEKIQKFADHFAIAKLSANSEYEIEYENEIEIENENEILVSK